MTIALGFLCAACGAFIGFMVCAMMVCGKMEDVEKGRLAAESRLVAAKRLLETFGIETPKDDGASRWV